MLTLLVSVALMAQTAGAPPRPAADTVAQDSVPSPALVARGDSVFHGKGGGGICFTCHGADARGMPGMGPNLTDTKWLHGDGSRAFIARLVTTGVPRPKESAIVMMPYGGVPLTPAQVEAVAAYVWSLGQRAK